MDSTRRDRYCCSLKLKWGHLFTRISQPFHVLFNVVAQFFTLAADRDAPGFVLRLRVGDHIADAFARMNGDADVTKLAGGERRARLDGVVFDVAAQDLLDDQTADVYFAAFKLCDPQFQKLERRSLFLVNIIERQRLAQNRKHLFLNFFDVKRRVPPAVRETACLERAVAENAEVSRWHGPTLLNLR